MMKKHYRSVGTCLLRCGIMMALGLWMLLYPRHVEAVTHKGTLIGLSMLFAVDVLEFLAYTPKRSREGLYKFGAACAFGGLLLFVYARPRIYLSFFPLILGLWVLFNALVRTVSFVLYQINKAPGRLGLFVLSALSYAFGLALVLHPRANFRAAVYALGCYLLAYGVTNIGDALRILGLNKRRGTRRGFRVSLPVAVSALLPYGMIRRVNDFIDDETFVNKRTRRQGDTAPFDAAKEDAPPDLEVFIHVAEKGFRSFGHVDISFGGTMYVYGSFDERTRRFFRTFGEGHFIVTDKVKEYLAFCCHEHQKTIYGFGLRLNEAQRRSVQRAIDDIRPLLVPYVSDDLRAARGELPKALYQDYASRLCRVTGAQMYRFSSGRFKTYFNLGTNCVLLADTLIGASGSDIISMTGIITPGTYFDYLNRQFLIEHSNVISRRAYTLNNQRVVIDSLLGRLDGRPA